MHIIIMAIVLTSGLDCERGVVLLPIGAEEHGLVGSLQRLVVVLDLANQHLPPALLICRAHPVGAGAGGNFLLLQIPLGLGRVRALDGNLQEHGVVLLIVPNLGLAVDAWRRHFCFGTLWVFASKNDWDNKI
jgi:hypothetical protein